MSSSPEVPDDGGSISQHPYQALTPDLILDAVESQGYCTDARMLALNSHENRVYQIGTTEHGTVIAKFYRPERWSQAQILEEHCFALELEEAEIPLVAPLRNEQGETLHQFGGFQFALYPNCGGRAPELDNAEHLLQLGRLTGRIHAFGVLTSFQHRPSLTLEHLGEASREFVLGSELLPDDLRPAYETVTRDLLEKLTRIHDQHWPAALIRLHGDCHPGNILCRGEQFFFVDLDDCLSGPAIQDLWMFLSGDRSQQQLQLSELVEGYNEFSEFDPGQLHLVEYLRSLRLLHYSAWLARRWQDPAFPLAFPCFATPRYWADHLLALREQLWVLDEPPLRLL